MIKIAIRAAAFTALISIIVFNGCAPLNDTSNPASNDSSSDSGEVQDPFEQSYNIDPQTGVQYYLDNDFLDTHALPDGSDMPLVLVPGGTFLMGLDSTDPLGIQPSGKVQVAINAFYVGQFEVTNGQYKAFLNDLPTTQRNEMLPDSAAWNQEIGVPWDTYFNSENFNDYPVVAVNWDQAQAFAEWAGLRLPAESEWEFAARSGVSGRIYPWDGLDIRSRRTGQIMANFAPGGDYSNDGFVLTSPVGIFPPNNFRLYDIAGNVAEWCQDSYHPSYAALVGSGNQLVTPVNKNPNEVRRIVRGGSWASREFYVGVGVRDFRHKEDASPRIGFRVAKSVTDPSILLRGAQQLPGVNMINTNVDRRMGTPDERPLNRPMQQTRTTPEPETSPTPTEQPPAPQPAPPEEQEEPANEEPAEEPQQPENEEPEGEPEPSQEEEGGPR